MNVLQTTRLENARFLIQEAGSVGAFARLLGRDASYVSQIAGPNPRKSIGDRMARHIERCLDKPKDWLDTPHTYPAPVEATLKLTRSDTDFVTLRIACLQKGDEGVSILLNKGTMGGVPREALERLGISEDDALLVEVHGDAHGYALPDGSIVAINTLDTNIRDGKLYAIRNTDLLQVRILIPRPGGGLILRCFDRHDYPDEVLTAEEVGENIQVLGRVFWSATAWQ